MLFCPNIACENIVFECLHICALLASFIPPFYKKCKWVIYCFEYFNFSKEIWIFFIQGKLQALKRTKQKLTLTPGASHLRGICFFNTHTLACKVVEHPHLSFSRASFLCVGFAPLPPPSCSSPHPSPVTS